MRPHELRPEHAVGGRAESGARRREVLGVVGRPRARPSTAARRAAARPRSARTRPRVVESGQVVERPARHARSRAVPRRTRAGCRPRPVSASVSHSSVLPLRGVAHTRYEITAGRAPRAAPRARPRRPRSARCRRARDRGLRRLVRVVDAGQAMQRARAGAPVQALGIALLAHLERRVDVDLDERRGPPRRGGGARARGARRTGRRAPRARRARRRPASAPPRRRGGRSPRATRRRTRGRRTGRGAGCRRRSGRRRCRAPTSCASSAAAIVDLPDDGRPVSQIVAPCWPSAAQRSSRVASPRSHTTFGLRAPPSRTASTTMPAATVAFVASSIRMKLPVARLSA